MPAVAGGTVFGELNLKRFPELHRDFAAAPVFGDLEHRIFPDCETSSTNRDMGLQLPSGLLWPCRKLPSNLQLRFDERATCSHTRYCPCQWQGDRHFLQ